MVDWIKMIISPSSSLGIPRKDQHKFQIFAAVACDLLWFYRNKAFHDGLTFDAALLVSKRTIKVSSDHFNAWHKISSPMESWLPPHSCFKINFDIAIRDSVSVEAAVCQNHQGHTIKMISKISPPCLPNYGEALAAHLVVSLALSLNLGRFILEGDSQVVISALQHPHIPQD
jgi:hypothetical protein